jgi:uridine phosphorylase
MNFLSPDPSSLLRPKEMVKAFSARKGLGSEDLRLEKLAMVTFTRLDLLKLIEHMGTARKIEVWGNRSNQIFRGKGWVAIHSPFGAPNVVMLLEEIVTFGVERVIFLGYCGSLQEEVRVGDIVLPMEALREEGTSYHYLEEGEKSLPDHSLQDLLANWMADAPFGLHRGPIWTTDAPYRETREKVIRYRREGILGVEMEMSAAFAFGLVKGVSIGSVLLVSDELRETDWRHGFFTSDLKKAREKAIEVVSCHLQELSPR